MIAWSLKEPADRRARQRWTRLGRSVQERPAGTTQTWWMPSVLQHGTTYYLAIKVRDQAGNASDLSNVVQLTAATDQPGNLAPVAVATADVTSGPTPLAAEFSSVASHDADGSVALCVWDFGDGVVTNEPNPAHTFNIVGTNPCRHRHRVQHQARPGATASQPETTTPGFAAWGWRLAGSVSSVPEASNTEAPGSFSTALRQYQRIGGA